MKFKKYLYLLIAAAVLFSMPVVSFANDYDGHWAYSDIEYLINRNIVIPNGGEVRPDEYITRAEFIKVINNIFEIPDLNTDNIYLDVTDDKWYYNEILKATGYGILTGDGTGYCYPENKITRAEASVVLSRVLKLEVNLSETAFSDNSEIPYWARPHIAILVAKGIINGYTDNSFKANNSITRAEAFSLSVRSGKTLNEEAPVAQTPQSPAVSMGGGGGGGGSTTTPAISLSAPVIKRMDTASGKLYFGEVFGADSYEVSLTVTTLGKSGTLVLNTSLTEVDLTNDINTLSGNEKSQTETFNVKVRAKSGLLYSSYSQAVDFAIVTELPNAVSVPEIKSGTDILDGTEKVYFSWDNISDAAGYELLVDFEDSQGYITVVNNTLTNKVYLTDYVSLDNLKESYNVKFKVYSSNPELTDSLYVNKSAEVSLYGGKDGDYDIILSKRHFLNIAKNPSGKYILKADIDLGAYTPFEFSGTLKGDNPDTLKNITVNINDTSGNAGLFSVISGSVNISDISISGTVKGNMVAGSVAGSVEKISSKGDAVLKNIVNYADITSTSTATSSYAGGIIGNAYGDSSFHNASATHLINYGDVKGGTAAGIFGYVRGGVSYCANHGNITATRLGAGGILGSAYASCDASYNTGDVSGTTVAGGITSSTSNELESISNCFNTGNVSCSGGNASGILGSHTTNVARKVYVYNCYNIGDISSSTSVGEIYIHDVTLGNLVASNNYYISDVHTTDEDDGYEGTYPVTADYLKDIKNLKKEEDGILREFSQSAWEIADNPYGYSYPQLIGNPYLLKPQELDAPVIFNVENNNENKVFVTVKGDVNTLNYTLKVFEENNEIGNFTLDGGSETVKEITGCLNGFGKDYTLKITANGDGNVYLSSEGADYTYRHNEYIAPPEGEGTKENPYIISRIENFKYITTYGQDKHYKITCDLDFTDNNEIYYTVLGETENAAFTGSLTGDKNGEKPVITIDVENNGANGFVRYLNGDIDNFIIDGSITGSVGVGSVAGYMLGGSVKNTENRADILSNSTSTTGFNAYTGGIIGEIPDNNSLIKIENCINYGTVQPHTFAKAVGGIVGHIKSGAEVSIKYCGNCGGVKGFSNVGGIAGLIDRATDKKIAILFSYNTATVTGKGEDAVAKDNSGIGGILGNGPANIDQCFNSGAVEGCNNTGGIVGLYETVNVNITLSNSYNSGNIKPLATTNSYKNNGGLSGAMNVNNGTGTITVKNNYNGGSVTFNRAHWPVYVSAPASSVIENNFYIGTLEDNTLSSPTGTAVAPVKIEEADMIKELSFTGFDFEDIWEIKTEGAYKYPQLKENPHKQMR